MNAFKDHRSSQAFESRSFFLNTLFVLLLLCVFAKGSWLWLARISWMILPILFAIDIRYAVYSAFYFSTFFQPSGYFVNPWFTLKYFHIVILLTIIVRMMNGVFHKDLIRGLKSKKIYYAIFAILFIGVVNFSRLGLPLSSLRTPGNLTLVLCMIIYLTGLVLNQWHNGNRDIIKLSGNWMVYGAATQIVVAFWNMQLHSDFLRLSLPHNNHLGILSSFCVMFALSSYINAKTSYNRLFRLFILGVLFCGLIASLSRTAWFTFWFSFFLYLFLIDLHLKTYKSTSPQIKRRVIIGLFIFLLMSLIIFDRAVFERFTTLPQLLDMNYWKYTLADQKNFGFLGVLRLRDLKSLYAILSRELFLGTGFIRKTVDMHGFYMVVLGSTGAVGFSLFIYFLYNLLRSLWKILWINDQKSAVLKVVVFGVIFIWVLGSFMETYFLQFFIWTNVAMAVMLIESASEGSISNELSP